MSLPIPDRPAPPADALPLRDAAARCDRSLSTLRAWIREGRLTGYRAAGENPANAPVLVSLAELRAFLVTSGAEVAPARPPAGPRTIEPPEARAILELRAELATVRGALAVALAERDGARSTVDAQRVALDVSGQRAAELARSLEGERARVAGLEAELAALRGAARLPWWRRLLPLVGSPATLPDPTASGSTGGDGTP